MGIDYRAKMKTSEKQMFDEMSRKMSKVILAPVVKKLAINIEEKLKNKLIKVIEKSEVFYSLTLGGAWGKSLRAEFGMSYDEIGFDELDEVVEAIIGSIVVTPYNFRFDRDGPVVEIKIQAIKKNLEDALALSQAVVDSDKGPIRWLEWLSFSGDSILISGYSIIYGNFDPAFSRSGKAIMVQSKKFWRIPSEYAGTDGNNWITRQVETANEEILDTIGEVIEESVKR